VLVDSCKGPTMTGVAASSDVVGRGGSTSEEQSGGRESESEHERRRNGVRFLHWAHTQGDRVATHMG
jgi:hypothetical protein